MRSRKNSQARVAMMAAAAIHPIATPAPAPADSLLDDDTGGEDAGGCVEATTLPDVWEEIATVGTALEAVVVAAESADLEGTLVAANIAELSIDHHVTVLVEDRLSDASCTAPVSGSTK